MQRTPMTLPGAEALKQELTQLKTIDRPKVIEAIAEARAHGDLKENAEYHAAREQQGLLEARIRDLESKLSSAQVIDVAKLAQDGRVVFGVTVELLNIETEQTVRYQIVGVDEADLSKGKISVGTPIARALIGKQQGDEVVVQAPGGDVEYEIVEVLYL